MNLSQYAFTFGFSDVLVDSFFKELHIVKLTVVYKLYYEFWQMYNYVYTTTVLDIIVPLPLQFPCVTLL